jgi:hypothetical protein
VSKSRSSRFKNTLRVIGADGVVEVRMRMLCSRIWAVNLADR